MTHRIIAAIAALALLAPAAALASRPDRPSANRPDRPDRPSANRPDRPGAGTGQAIRRTFIFRGTVSATDAAAGTVVLRVRHGNRAARRFVGLDVPFALAGARIVAADRDGDGDRDVADVRAGDRVVVQARLPRDVTASAPLSARRLIDLTSPPVDEDEDAVDAAVPAP